MKTTMKEHHFNQWMVDLKFDKVDKEDQVVRAVCRDPFRAVYIVRRYGGDLLQKCGRLFGL